MLAGLVPLRAAWAAEVLLLALLLVVPGLLLLRALRVPGNAIASFPAYIPCASLVVLLACGLAVDLTGPLVGVTQPLRAGPLLAGLELCCVGLFIAGWRARPDAAIPWRWPASSRWLFLPLLLPVLAAAGALRLNNGHSSAVAVVAVGACWVVLAVALAASARLDKALLSVILYAVTLALTWGFSLRGDLVYGFDISSEYHALQQTIETGIWHTSHVGDAYGALLSVTVLPTELHALSGIAGLLVFKAVYPAVWAVFPVMVFHLASRVISHRWAFAATAITIAQQPLFQQMPGLARQEIALVLFAALVAAVLDGGLPRWPRLSLAAAFSLGMAVSHYSTTYFAIVMFAVALVLQFGLSWLRPMPRFALPMVVAVVAIAGGAAIWYGLVTQSAANLSQLISAGKGQGFDLLPSGGGNLLARYLQAGAPTTIPAGQYAAQVHGYYVAHVPYVHPLPDAARPVYAVRSPATASPPARWQLGVYASGRAQLVIEQLVNLVAAVGALCLVLRKRSSVLARQVGLLGLGTLAVLAVLRLSGTAAASYNPERAFLQALVVLAAALAWAFQALAGASKRRRLAALVVSVAVVCILLANASGIIGETLGGGTDTNLANSGTDYNEFDMSAPELAAASWLSKQAQPGQLVYADRYAGLRLMAIMGDRPGMLSDITPLTLNSQAWIYASQTNVTQRSAVSYFQDQYGSYAFPFGFLNANYDLAYTNGTSEVYYR